MARKARAETVKQYVGPIVWETLHECSCQLKTDIALCQVVQNSGKCDDYEGMVKHLKAFKKDHTKRIQHIDRLIEDAQRFQMADS